MIRSFTTALLFGIITSLQLQAQSAKEDLECVRGFTLELNATDSNSVGHNNYQLIFPSIKFMCSGYIKKWIFFARFRYSNATPGRFSLYPEFQIWRHNSSLNGYVKVGHTTINTDEQLKGDFQNYNRISQYTYEVNTTSDTMYVEPGDVIGVSTPNSRLMNGAQSRLRLRFYHRPQNDGPMIYQNLMGDGSPEKLSFFNLSLASINKSLIPVISVQVTSSDLESSHSAGAGGIAAGVCITILTVLLVLSFAIPLVVIFRRRVKQKEERMNTKSSSNVWNNPTYDDANQQHASHEFVGGRYCDVQMNDSTGHYEFAEHCSNVEIAAIKINSSQNVNTEGPSSERIYEPPGMQWGLYVPTTEKRNTSSIQAVNNQQQNSEAHYSTLCHDCHHDGPGVFFKEDNYWSPSSKPEELYSQLSEHKFQEIIRQQILLFNKLGSGEFGTVHKGVWHSPGGPVDVAVKMLKDGAKEKDRVKFLQEAAINGQFHHPSIIKLQGVVTVDEPVIIVLEFMPHGDLKTYLTGLRPSPGELPPPGLAEQCLKFCRQVCSGMKYLSSKSFVHRDLAARNILVSKDKTCKIADFGMARDIEESDYYVSHGGKIPVKWTAPEALNYKKYSSASDVWSFGALMYEIWSLGRKPFEKYSNIEVTELVSGGFRLPPPPGCPLEVYKLKIKCWHPEASCRPTFSDLVTSLNQPVSKLLTCPSDADPPEAVVLGAPLEMGENLYKELQKSYVRL